MHQQHDSNKNDRKMFQEIPIKQRSAYRKKMIQSPQLKGNQPKFFQKEYPNHGKFKYGEFQLSYGYIETSDKPDALVFFWHGMYCYGGMSGYFADVLTKSLKKVNIYALDFKNAGLSEGDCPGFYTIEDLEDQGIKFVQFIEEKFKSSKPKSYVMGQSMGGLVTFKLSVKHPEKFSGAIMLAPALKDCYQCDPALKKLGRVMGYLCPKWKIVPQDFVGYTRYQNFEYMKNEKGRYIGQHPPGTAYSLLKQLDTTQKYYSKMFIPYIIIQGGMDKSIDLFAPLDLDKQSPSKDKTIIYYKDVWHDILVQKQIQQIAPRIVKWLKDRI